MTKEAMNNNMFIFSSHSGESRNPVFSMFFWMPAFAGMTKKTINQRIFKLIVALVSLYTFMLAETGTAYAQGQFGVEGGYNFKRESVMAGGRFVVPISAKVKMAPQLAVDFEIDKLILDVDFHMMNPGTSVYFLAGLNYANDDAGLNLGGALSVDLTKNTKGFLELKYVAFGWDGLIFKGGVLF